MKKKLSVVLAICMLLSLMSIAGYAAESDTPEPVGFSSSRVVKADLTGVRNILNLDDYPEETAYFVNSAQGLLRVSKAVNFDFYDFRGVTIYITRDIDMTGQEWTPIGNNDNACFFAGTLDGMGHVIDNLVYENDDNTESTHQVMAGTGLVGFSHGCTIKNLVLGAGCSFTFAGTSGDNRTGAFIGSATIPTVPDVPTTIDNCLNLASVTGKNYTAGFIGQGYDLSKKNGAGGNIVIRNSTNAGNVTSDNAAGGFVGYAASGTYLINCRNTGTITTNSTDPKQTHRVAGGLIGRGVDNYAGSKIEHCINNGELRGAICGGIIGTVHFEKMELRDCANYKLITSEIAGAELGSIVGKMIYTGSVQIEFDNQDLSGQTDSSLAAAELSVVFDASKDDSPEEIPDNPGGETTDDPGSDSKEPPKPTSPVTQEESKPATDGESGTKVPAAQEKETGCKSSAAGGLAVLLCFAGAAALGVGKRKK